MVGGSVVGGFNEIQFPSLLTNCFCLLFVNESFSKTGLNDSFKIRRYSNAKYGALSIKWLLSFLSICNLDWLAPKYYEILLKCVMIIIKHKRYQKWYLIDSKRVPLTGFLVLAKTSWCSGTITFICLDVLHT